MTRPIDPILEQLAAAGQAELVERLRELGGTPLQRTIVEALAAGIEQHGIAGVAFLAGEIDKVIGGTESVTLDLTDLRASSALLGAMQRLEADERSEVRDMLARIVAVLGPIVGALLRLAVASPK